MKVIVTITVERGVVVVVVAVAVVAVVVVVVGVAAAAVAAAARLVPTSFPIAGVLSCMFPFTFLSASKHTFVCRAPDRNDLSYDDAVRVWQASGPVWVRIKLQCRHAPLLDTAGKLSKLKVDSSTSVL